MGLRRSAAGFAALAVMTFMCLAWAGSPGSAQTPLTTLSIEPETLNLGSDGKWISAKLTAGRYYTWQHGFLPGPDQYNHPDVTANIGYNAWYSYTSPNLMQLTPGQNPVTKMWSAIPEIVLGVEVGGNGWDFSGKADSIALTGIRKRGHETDCADRQGRGFKEENLLSNGGFRKGFDSWGKISGQNPGNPGQFSWTIDTTDGTPAPSFSYARTNSNSDGGKVGVYQEIGKRVTRWNSLTATCAVKILSNSLTDSGWWWPLNGGWGETPGRLIVHYMSNLSSGNINRATVKLQGADTNNDGVVDVLLNLPIVKPWCLGDGSLLVKFDRRALSKALLSAPFADKSVITLVVTGSFLDGTAFSAADYIKVIGKTKSCKGPKK